MLSRTRAGWGTLVVLGTLGAISAIGSGCGQQDGTSHALSREDAAARASALRALGAQMFVDTTLSASGRLSCASCHRPDRAFGPPDGRAVQIGGASGLEPGTRAVPSLRYLQAVPPFSRHAFLESDEGPDKDESIDAGPTGGLTWDGRVDRGRDQAMIPLLSPVEMANPSEQAIGAKVLAAGYGAEVRRLARDAGAGPSAIAVQALEAYEQTPELFSPYSSRYDAVLRGAARLTSLEQRGLDLFNDPLKGHCASCHPSRPDRHGVPPAFSDYGFVALGLPRNAEIPANADPNYVDLGLCGPTRSDLSSVREYCGRFRTPTLRNVATRSIFFHNGVVHRLRDAVAFYATRDTDPSRWFGKDSTGLPRLFTDLPNAYRGNVESGAPFGRTLDRRPRLDVSDIDAIVAFLETLTDADALNVNPQIHGGS
jgi:cytochrome c peroxidase